MSTTDFTLHYEGSNLMLLKPLTEAAETWANEHLPEDVTTWGIAFVIEPRYAPPIVEGIEADGLTVAMG